MSVLNKYFQPLITFFDIYKNARNKDFTDTLPAPVILEPANNTEFTRSEILAGTARISWQPVDGAEYYKLIMRGSSSNQNSERVIFSGTSYTFQENPDLQDTLIANNEPVQFYVQAVGANSGPGLESIARTFTILTGTK